MQSALVAQALHCKLYNMYIHVLCKSACHVFNAVKYPNQYGLLAAVLVAQALDYKHAQPTA